MTFTDLKLRLRALLRPTRVEQELDEELAFHIEREAVLRINPVMGRPLTLADDARSGGEAVMVLSHKGWDRRFNRDPDVVGRTVLVNGVPFQIVGVTAAGFRGLEVGGSDAWAPLSQVGHFRPQDRGREEAVGVEVIGRLRPDVSKENARAQVAARDSNRPAESRAGWPGSGRSAFASRSARRGGASSAS
jgi:hypothetical protein